MDSNQFLDPIETTPTRLLEQLLGSTTSSWSPSTLKSIEFFFQEDEVKPSPSPDHTGTSNQSNKKRKLEPKSTGLNGMTGPSSLQIATQLNFPLAASSVTEHPRVSNVGFIIGDLKELMGRAQNSHQEKWNNNFCLYVVSMEYGFVDLQRLHGEDVANQTNEWAQKNLDTHAWNKNKDPRWFNIKVGRWATEQRQRCLVKRDLLDWQVSCLNIIGFDWKTKTPSKTPTGMLGGEPLGDAVTSAMAGDGTKVEEADT